jgi:hypothetical protein
MDELKIIKEISGGCLSADLPLTTTNKIVDTYGPLIRIGITWSFNSLAYMLILVCIYQNPLMYFFIKPTAVTTAPAPIIKYPFAVHCGFRYINEEDGPTIELLCSRNMIPKTSVMTPTIKNVLLTCLTGLIDWNFMQPEYLSCISGKIRFSEFTDLETSFRFFSSSWRQISCDSRHSTYFCYRDWAMINSTRQKLHILICLR